MKYNLYIFHNLFMWKFIYLFEHFGAPYAHSSVHLVPKSEVNNLSLQLVCRMQYRWMGFPSTFRPLPFSTLISPAAPKFTREPSDVAVDIGSNVTLPCLAQGYPEPQVTWRREDGLPLSNRPPTHGTITQSRGGLHFTSKLLSGICAYTLYM